MLGFYLRPIVVQIFNTIAFCSKMVNSSGMRKWMLIRSSLDSALYVWAGAWLQDNDGSNPVSKLKITFDQKTIVPKPERKALSPCLL